MNELTWRKCLSETNWGTWGASSEAAALASEVEISDFSISQFSAVPQSPSTTHDSRQDSSETKTFLLRVQLPPLNGRQRAAPTS